MLVSTTQRVRARTLRFTVVSHDTCVGRRIVDVFTLECVEDEEERNIVVVALQVARLAWFLRAAGMLVLLQVLMLGILGHRHRALGCRVGAWPQRARHESLAVAWVSASVEAGSHG